MRIPSQLEEALKKDRALLGAVMLSLEEFKPWLETSGVPFFPEYTDHGPKHIESVLQTADALIRDEGGRTAITPSDAATLILATLLHDSAMHLSEDGFIELILLNDKSRSFDGFDDKSWALLWQDFIAEARRFDGRKLMALFGDTTPVHRPELDSQKMTRRDRLLIGEFLRRHHHRLAHEIALLGVPGLEDNKLRLKAVPEDVADLAGVVARSHGLPVRSCLEYLRLKYDLREYKGVHAVFLMALLRVADYLQVQAERAPKQVLQVRRLRSPISQGEWEAHHGVRDIRHTHEDPEAIFIDAAPSNVKAYLKIKKWLDGIQSELDASWAVLGEVYGRYEGLDQLGLTLRRVRSTFDDQAVFTKNVNYVPIQAAFETANPDLLKLLIGPLYGDRPEIGLRELIQNAVDAVRELREYQKQRPDKVIELTPQAADVVVSLDEESNGTCWLKVSDRGIGMTSEIVHEYFLKAGASYRQSDAWRKRFENEEGKSRVLRSGRFGVGALASFLLGDEIHVSTRHPDVPANEGVAFVATLDSEAIELQRVNRPVGTTVLVQLNNEAQRRLKNYQHEENTIWNWYCLNDPAVICIINPGDKKIPQKHQLPEAGLNLPPNWHSIQHPDYQCIHWTYSNAPNLICNGIEVEKGSQYRSKSLWGKENKDIPLIPPRISVFDPDGRLPLILQRTKLAQEEYPFNKELLEDVLRDFIAFALVHAPSKPITDKSVSEWYNKVGYSGLTVGSDSHHLFHAPWFSTNLGVSFSDSWHIHNVGIRHAILTTTSYQSYGYRWIPNFELNSAHAILSSTIRGGITGAIKWLRFVLRRKDSDRRYEKFQRVAVLGTRILLQRQLAEEIIKSTRFPNYIQSQINETMKTENWVLWQTGECPADGLNFQKFVQEFPDPRHYGQLNSLTEWYLNDKQWDAEHSPVAMVWRDMIGSQVIPFDPTERRLKLAKAFEILKPYIEAHEAIASKKAV